SQGSCRAVRKSHAVQQPVDVGMQPHNHRKRPNGSRVLGQSDPETPTGATCRICVCCVYPLVRKKGLMCFMKSITRPALLTALLLVQVTSTAATSIGVSFLGDTDHGSVLQWQLAPADSAGFVVQSNWNNLATTATLDVGISDLLVDDMG